MAKYGKYGKRNGEKIGKDRKKQHKNAEKVTQNGK